MSGPPGALGTWRTLARSEPSPSALHAFHARHKMELLAHDEVLARTMGRVVADARAETMGEAMETYESLLAQALGREPTRGSNANALSHLVGHVGDPARARALASRVEAYRRGDEELADVRKALREALAASGATWALSQSYLAD